MNSIDPASWNLWADAARVAARQKAWEGANVPARLWECDPALWPEAPAADVAGRTGWLRLPEVMRDRVAELDAFAEEARAEGTRHVVLLGMGGSSLAPDVFRRIFGGRSGYPELLVLDSTHPDAVAAVAARIDPARTLFVVSSKSGTTTEPLDFFRYFWKVVRTARVPPAPRFVAVTDPGSPLEKLGVDRGFRAVFRALPTVGGRYSALTMFGLVPAALLGVDLRGVLDRARAMAEACGPSVPTAENPGLSLGAVLGELATHGRDKLTFYASPGLAPFPVWVEQLVAESTGKAGRGIVPVVDEPPAAPDRYGTDRLFVEIQEEGRPDAAIAAHTARLEAAGHPVVRLRVREPIDLGQEFFRWELAVASAGMVLGINPFDQPDVEVAKELAREAMVHRSGRDPAAPVPAVRAESAAELAASLALWTGSCRPGDYVGIQAYLAPTPETVAALERLRVAALERLRVATTVGLGPRFLHSTGQLHKGGPDTGLFLQLVDAPTHDVEVPGAGYTFGELIRAQSLGDYRALQQKGRRVLRVDLGTDVGGGLRRLETAIHG
jgi:transaldolase/glucose-6-phosphate isomerase